MARDRETEIKLRISGVAAVRRPLRRAGFRVAHRRALERNTVYDTLGSRLRRSGLLLRLREAGTAAVLTFKGKAIPGRHKSREELEIELPGVRAFARILERLGFFPVFRYQKYRTEYQDGRGKAMLDETPMGAFLELEGAPGWIDRTAERLGFAVTDYLTASYAELYRRFRRRHPGSPRDMVFGKQLRRRRRR